jgi:flagellar hook-associated protein 1 FlgK
MGLTSALQLGRSALNASALAIEVTGNNFANAATRGYSRQTIALMPSTGSRYGNAFIGRGVQIQGIHRQIDGALQARLWTGISQEASASIDLQLFSAVEATLNELTDHDLSSELSSFFNAWSELANSPAESGTRSLVVQQGAALADHMRQMREDLNSLRLQIDQQLDASVQGADELLTQIADLNTAIVNAEAGSATANSLRDQRDSLITELAQYLDITTVEQPSGTIDVLVGSIPVVLAGVSRGIEVEKTVNGGETEVAVAVKDDGQNLSFRGGSVGALLDQRGALVDDTISKLDDLAAQLIFQVNRIHSTGYGTTPLTSVRGTQVVSPADVTRALNDPANTSFADLPFQAVNGGFLVTVTNSATGASETVRVDVDLDGLDASGAPGFADDTSLADIAAAIDGAANLSATVNADGTLSIEADDGYSVAFSEDTSGVLAVLGVNTYFTGTSAQNIDVRAALQSEPGLVNTGRLVDGKPSDSGAALAIALLQDEANDSLGGLSLRESWLDTTQSLAVRTDAAVTRANATTMVRQSLDAQRAAVSGVSIDEESVNLLTFQRQYQGAARYISVVDEMTQTLLSLV